MQKVVQLLYEQGALKHRGDIAAPIITEGLAVSKEPETIIYPFTDTGQGSCAFKFFKPIAHGCAIDIWDISDGGSSSERLRLYVDENGYIHAQAISEGISLGLASIEQNVCNERVWTIGIRWTSAALHLLAYSHTTQTLYTDSTSIAQLPTGLDQYRPIIPCFGLIGNSRLYDYYESDNYRLLFG